MRKRFIIVAAVFLVAAAVSLGSAPPRARQLQIRMSIKQGDPLGSVEEGSIKVLSEPKLVTLEKREASLFGGGELTIDGEAVDFGDRLSVTAQRAAGGRLRLRLVTEHSEVLEKRENNVRIQTNRVLHLRTVKPGEVFKLRWGNPPPGSQKWVEMSVHWVD